jgi:hypothetical protein
MRLWTSLLALSCSDPPAPGAAVVDTAPKEEEAPATAAPPPALPCPSPWLPMVEGASWEHEAGEGRRAKRVKTTVGRIDRTALAWRATVEVRTGNRTATGTAECDASGAWFDLFALHAIADTGDAAAAADIRSGGRTGPLIPAGAAFAVDATWEGEVATLVALGDSLMKRSTVRSTIRWKRLADEDVETADATLRAAHLHGEATSREESVIMGRTEAPRDLPAWTIDLWLAEGVGEVRSVVLQDGARREWRLVSHTIPSG